MLTAKKKIDRKELKQDALLTGYVKASGFYYQNRKYLNYGISAIVVLLIIGVVYFNNRRANEEKATAELSKVFRYFEAGTQNPSQFALAIDGKPELGIIGLKKIVENYGGTDAGMLARFYLGNALYHTGQREEAMTHFENFSSDDVQLEASAVAGIGDCLDALGRMHDAAVAYERAVRTAPEGINAAEYAHNAGRCYGIAGETEDALRMFRLIKDEYPEAAMALDVDRSIARFTL